MMKKTRERKPASKQEPRHGLTPLHKACLAGDNLTAVSKLIEDGAAVNAVEELGQTPLVFASRKGHLDVVKILVENGANVNHECEYPPEETALIQAITFHHPNVTEYLMRNGARLERYNLKAFVTFIEIMNETAVQLITSGANDANPKIVDKGETYLREAVARGWFEVAKALLAVGARVNSVSSSGDILLRDIKDDGLVRLLIDHGANVNGVYSNRRTLLHRSASAPDHLERVRLLLENGARVNAQDKNGLSPLHLACLARNEEVALLLFEHGGDITSEIRNPVSPFSGKSALAINPEFDLSQCIRDKLNRVMAESEVKSEKLEENRMTDWIATSEIKKLRLENKTLRKELATARVDPEALRLKCATFKRDHSTDEMKDLKPPPSF